MFERLNDLKINLNKTTSIKDIPEEMGEEFNEAVFICVEACKPTVKQQGMDATYLLIEKEIEVRWLQEYLRSALERVMFPYNSLAPLRRMQENDALSLVGFINDIFDNCILRNNVVFLESYEEHGIESEEQMDDISLSFKTLVRFYVIHRYTQNSIIIDFTEETGLNESVAKIVAEIIEKNYSQLQMAFIMEYIASKR